MNALLEKLLNGDFENEEGFYKAINEIQYQAERAPAEWQPELEAATAKAREMSIAAQAEYNKAQEELKAAEAIYTDATGKFSENDPEMIRKAQAITEAKARAWDTYGDSTGHYELFHQLYEQEANVNYIMGNMDSAEFMEGLKKSNALGDWRRANPDADISNDELEAQLFPASQEADPAPKPSADEEKIKRYLLKRAAEKPVRLFKQFDVFQRIKGGDSIVTPDEDGDCIFGSGTPHYELNITNELRVMIPEDRTAEEIIRGLKKVIAWIEADPKSVDVHDPQYPPVFHDETDVDNELPF